MNIIVAFDITQALFHQMNGISFLDFNLVACDFLKFDWCKMLNGHADF